LAWEKIDSPASTMASNVITHEDNGIISGVEPKNYQKVNSDKLYTRRFGLLYMAMGTGKTLTVLMALYKLTMEIGQKLTVIIVLPNSVQNTFLREITKHYGTFFTVNNITSANVPIKAAAINIVPFSRLRSYTDETPDVLIVDEVHQARNPGTLCFKNLSALSSAATYTWMLTGTPIFNRDRDMHTITVGLKLGHKCEIIGTTKHVLNLPEVMYHTHQVPNRSVGKYKSRFVLAQITQERVESCYNLIKWELIKKLSRSGNTVVFTSFKGPLYELMAYLGTTLTINGDMTMSNRQDAIDTFQMRGGIIVCSYHAAGVGINLTNANRVIFLDPAWNAATINQAIDRVHRMGVKNIVDVHFLVQDGESWIYRLVKRKQTITYDCLKLSKEECPPIPLEEGVDRVPVDPCHITEDDN
jgi:superfamily II DNA or RNA helicase